ncbi:MAG: hypothetical protein ACM3QS_08935, partial [Bacteroidota bacterium]
MKRVLKWARILTGAAAILLVLGWVWVYSSTQQRLTRKYQTPDEPLVIPTDTASVVRGRHIFQFRGCQACHSAWSYVDLPGEEGEPAHLNLPSQLIPHMEGHVYLQDAAIG